MKNNIILLTDPFMPCNNTASMPAALSSTNGTNNLNYYVNSSVSAITINNEIADCHPVALVFQEVGLNVTHVVLVGGCYYDATAMDYVLLLCDSAGFASWEYYKIFAGTVGVPGRYPGPPATTPGTTINWVQTVFTKHQ
jgi:hypothetical protein